MKSPYTNIKSKPPKSISNQHNIKVPNKEKNLGTKIKKEKSKTFFNLQRLQDFTNTF
jgi:hypothetical protein